MATLWVVEFAELPQDERGKDVPVGNLGDVTVQKVTIAGTSAATTNGMQNTTRYVRLLADATCYVAVATSPTASSDTTPFGSEIPEYFGIQPGEKVAVITR